METERAHMQQAGKASVRNRRAKQKVPLMFTIERHL
jgi:hypothetical protein